MDEYRIAIALWDGVEELDFAGPYEVLTAWGRFSERAITVQTVAESAEPIRCAHGLRVIPDRCWDDAGRVDLLVLPGGNTEPLRANDAFLDRLRNLRRAGDVDDERLHRRARLCQGGLARRPARDDALERP